MAQGHWECPKCQNTSFDTNEFRATGGLFSKFFDVQNRKFTTVSCTKCKFTEMYKANSSMLGNLFDFFVGE